MQSSYSPFQGKEISQLDASDLQVLRSVGEGWYIEYKQEISSPKGIAKSISAFANTYGGWLFIGIGESKKSDNTADTFPGISNAETDKAIQLIRQSVASHLNPTPYFELKVIKGPNKDIDLADDCNIICVQTPFSVTAPHVHSSGSIYRRVSDGSEPKSENDRHQLDLLWARRDKINEEYKDWIERAPERSKSEKNQPYIRILLDADLYRAKGKSWNLSVDDLREVLSAESSHVGLPLESIFPTSRGIVARQTSSLTSFENFGLTWIFGESMRCEICMPVNCIHMDGLASLFENLDKFKHGQHFAKMLHEAKAHNVRVLDLIQVWMVFLACSTVYHRALNKVNFNGNGIFAKVIVGGVWRAVPFLDSKTMLERMEKYEFRFV